MWVTLLVLAGIALTTAFLPNPRALDGVSRTGGVVLLASWYSSSGRSQAENVKSRYGKDYPRRGWAKPLLLACLAFVVFVIGVVGRVPSFLKRGA